MNHIGIIGGGASALICAIELARKKHRVILFEKNTKLGRKILATGNGKCNISNSAIHLSRYHGESVGNIKEILKRFDGLKCQDYFRTLGLEITQGSKGRLYPMSQQAMSVVDILVHEARILGVEILLETQVLSISKKAQKFLISTTNTTHEVNACVIATGSRAMPKWGSSSSCYDFAQSFGHRIVEPFASLVQLISHEAHLELVSGVRMDASVELYVNNQKIQNAQGDILFAPYGLSGDAILEISRKASHALMLRHKVDVSLDLIPHLSQEALQALLHKRLAYAQNKPLLLWLEGMLPKKLALFILQKEKLNTQESSKIGMKEIKKLVFALKHMRFSISETKGLESAEVCAGGVDVSELSEKTLMSKKVDNLYFCGEVLDVDGDCGGFNLHFAWASGYVVAHSIV